MGKIVNNKIKIMACFVLISSALLVLTSYTTSPIYHISGSDSAAFRLMGRMIREGKIPYKDFFDHKGPFIMFLMWLGYGITGSDIGLLSIQILCLSASVFGICSLTNLFIEKKWIKRCILICFLILYGVYLEGGNIVEEYNLPFLIWSQYFCIKYLAGDQEKEHKPRYAFFYGITFAICIFTRATNALPLCIAVGVILTVLLYRKKYINLVKNALCFILGIGIVLIPVVIYFSAHDALHEMIYCTFTYNFKYASLHRGRMELMQLLGITRKTMICIFGAVVIGILSVRKNLAIAMIIILQSVTGIMVQFNSAMYRHYLLIYIPTVILSLVFYLHYYPKGKLYKIGVSLAVLGTILFMGFLGNDAFTKLHSQKDVRLAKEIDAVRNEIEKDEGDVVVYNSNCRFYVQTSLSPCYKYFHIQDFQCQYDERAFDEFKNEVESLKAKWIIEVRNRKNNEIIQQIIASHYREAYQTSHYILMKKK